MSKLRNLTPHAIVLLGESEDEPGIDRPVRIEPEAVPARVEVRRRRIGWQAAEQGQGDDALSIPVYVVDFGQVTGLPEAVQGTWLIVSRVVAEAARDRGDLLVVDDTVRDEAGRIVGARALATIAGEEARRLHRDGPPAVYADLDIAGEDTGTARGARSGAWAGW